MTRSKPASGTTNILSGNANCAPRPPPYADKYQVDGQPLLPPSYICGTPIRYDAHHLDPNSFYIFDALRAHDYGGGGANSQVIAGARDRFGHYRCVVPQRIIKTLLRCRFREDGLEPGL